MTASWRSEAAGVEMMVRVIEGMDGMSTNHRLGWLGIKGHHHFGSHSSPSSQCRHAVFRFMPSVRIPPLVNIAVHGIVDWCDILRVPRNRCISHYGVWVWRFIDGFQLQSLMMDPEIWGFDIFGVAFILVGAIYRLASSSFLLLVRGGASSAEDSHNHDHHDGDDTHRDDDDQEHAAVKRRRGAAMGAVTAAHWRFVVRSEVWQSTSFSCRP